MTSNRKLVLLSCILFLFMSAACNDHNLAAPKKALGGQPGASRQELAQLPEQFPRFSQDVPGLEATSKTENGKKVVRISFPIRGNSDMNVTGLVDALNAAGWSVDQPDTDKPRNLSVIGFSGFGWTGLAQFSGKGKATGLGSVALTQVKSSV